MASQLHSRRRPSVLSGFSEQCTCSRVQLAVNKNKQNEHFLDHPATLKSRCAHARQTVFNYQRWKIRFILERVGAPSATVVAARIRCVTERGPGRAGGTERVIVLSAPYISIVALIQSVVCILVERLLLPAGRAEGHDSRVTCGSTRVQLRSGIARHFSCFVAVVKGRDNVEDWRIECTFYNLHLRVG